MRCIRLFNQILLYALSQSSLAQSLTVNQSLVAPNGLRFTSPAISVPTPPPCTIQTQVCTSSHAPHWVPDPIPIHPDNYSKQNCSVSYVNGAGLWEFPVITQLPGRYEVPCGTGTVMTFQTRLGTAFVVYEGTFDGVPENPLIGIDDGKTVLEAWQDSNCSQGSYEGKFGPCYNWWCKVDCGL